MSKSKTKSRRAPFVPSFRRCLLLLLPAGALASTVVAQDKGATRPERPWPVAVDLADVRMSGELSKRLMASFDRLEEPFYSPPVLFDKPNKGWPGDKEGRTLLGLVLLEQVTGRPAKNLEASLDMYASRVNARGYLGPVMPPDAVHEQTLGGQFWVLNAFYEYEAWKKNGRVNAWADQILNNIYLEDAHRIYYNGLSVNQRNNGGLGCNSCPSVDKPFLTVVSQEATQCCTMRGADGLTKAAQYCFFKSDAGVIVPFYQDAQATLRWGEQSLTLLQKTGYPWAGEVRLEVSAAQGDEPRTLSLFTPAWAERPVLKLNGELQSVTSKDGFLNLSRRWRAGDVVELSFEQSVAAMAPINQVNGADRVDYRTFHYGPLMLGYAGPKAVTVKPDARFSRRGERDFLVEGTDLVLQPIYHLLDPAVSKDRGYRRQILFP